MSRGNVGPSIDQSTKCEMQVGSLHKRFWTVGVAGPSGEILNPAPCESNLRIQKEGDLLSRSPASLLDVQ